jgi:hypothetical protein
MATCRSKHQASGYSKEAACISFYPASGFAEPLRHTSGGGGSGAAGSFRPEKNKVFHLFYGFDVVCKLKVESCKL